MKNIQTFVEQAVHPSNSVVVTLGYPYDNSPFAVYSHEPIKTDCLNIFNRNHYVAIVESVYKIVNIYIFETNFFAHNFPHTGLFVNCVTGWYLPATLTDAGNKSILPEPSSLRTSSRVGYVRKIEDKVNHLDSYIINTPFSDPTKESLYKQVLAWFRQHRVKADVRFYNLIEGTFVLQSKRFYENGKMNKI